MTKSNITRNYVKTACNVALIFLITNMLNIFIYWILDKNDAFFSDIYFCMDFMMGMVSEDILPTYFGSIWSRATNKIADTPTERACQS